MTGQPYDSAPRRGLPLVGGLYPGERRRVTSVMAWTAVVSGWLVGGYLGYELTGGNAIGGVVLGPMVAVLVPLVWPFWLAPAALAGVIAREHVLRSRR